MSKTQQRDYSSLLKQLAQEYTAYSPKSAALNGRALKVLVDGGSHANRLLKPFPPRVASAQGAYVTDVDGHNILDFWQGHYANLLGHNPPVVVEAVVEAMQRGMGLQTGFTEQLQVEVAELLTHRMGVERVRFTTSGTLATMYAIMLARASTGRKLTMKVGGGWHGGHFWGLKGVGYQNGFDRMDSSGILERVSEDVIVTTYNRTQVLQDHIKKYGDQLACFILEPVIGSGGLFPATREYVQTARQLCTQYGVVLILDEVISGFRFHAGSAASLYGVEPDLLTLGKVIGGGMPVAAVTGRKEIMGLVGRDAKERVSFSGGTYSGHPASMMAAKTMLEYLVQHEHEVYPRLAEIARKTRAAVISAFTEEGIPVQFSGGNEDIPVENSLHQLRFPYAAVYKLDTPEEVKDPEITDVFLGETLLQLLMLLQDVYIVHGLGCSVLAHSEQDIQKLGNACRQVTRRLKPYF